MPNLVTASTTTGAVFVSDGASLLCYLYDARVGTTPTLMTSTSVANIYSMKIPSDERTLVYSKSGTGNLFWRTLSSCSLGNEQSVALSGSTGDVAFVFPDSPNVVFAIDGARTAVWKIQRSLSTGALSSVSTVSTAVCGSTLPAVAISPDGIYGYFCASSGNDLGVINLSTLAIQQVDTGNSVDIIVATGNSKGALVSQSGPHQGFTVNTSGAPVLNGNVTYTSHDLRYGGLLSLDKTFAYVGGPTSTSMWIHQISSSAPYVSSVTSSAIGFAPVAFAYLPGYSR